MFQAHARTEILYHFSYALYPYWAHHRTQLQTMSLHITAQNLQPN